MLSSNFDKIRYLLAGGVNGAISNPWYFLVFAPIIVELANPPNPFVIIHSFS